MGGSHTEVELKPQLSSRARATKEEEVKSLLMTAQTTELHPRDWLCKLSCYKHLNGQRVLSQLRRI